MVLLELSREDAQASEGDGFMIVPSEKEIREAAERNSGRFRMNATIGSRQAVVDRCILRDWEISEKAFLSCAKWFQSKLREPGG